jgi:hypothetical protein
MKSSVGLAVVAATALAGAWLLPTGCSTKGCTEIGCSSDVRVTVAGAVAAWDSMLPMNVNVCVDDCRQFKIERDASGTTCSGSGDLSWQCVIYAGNVTFVAPVHGAGSREISLVVTNDANAELFRRTASVAVSPYYANGYDCDKDYPCFQGTTEIQP